MPLFSKTPHPNDPFNMTSDPLAYFPLAHKTVFVIDHSPAYGASSRQAIDYDIISRSGRVPAGFIPLKPINKSLWTCTVESIIEYARIVYDIYGVDREIRLVISDHEATVLNSWLHGHQNVTALMNGLGRSGAPSRSKNQEDCNIIRGLTKAVELLGEPTPQQMEKMTPKTGASARLPTGGDLPNRGRIVCMTNVKNDAQVKMLMACLSDTIAKHNKAAAAENLLPIQNCEFALFHVTPSDEEPKIRGRSLTDDPLSSPGFSLGTEVIPCRSGTQLAHALVHQAQKHHRLACTTVTGIPMKEEQNAATSANYDVELLHPMEAHQHLIRTEAASIAKDTTGGETIVLKWCTPRSSVAELHHCVGAWPISPVDVNSRPSSCLTNFLLSGRSVMLEQPKKSGAKVLSHMLSSHGGEVFIHLLSSKRSILEDAPSISEGPGGRITDYRIPDFCQLMKTQLLAPGGNTIAPQELPEERLGSCDLTGVDPELGGPNLRARSLMERNTRYWPLVISETIVYHSNLLSFVDPLPSLVLKEALSSEELLECQKVIYNIVDMETKNTPLPIPGGVVPLGSGKGSKGHTKKDEQFRQLWMELERLVRCYADTSSEHRALLDCLLKCKKPSHGSLAESDLQGYSNGMSGGMMHGVEFIKEEPEFSNGSTEKLKRLFSETASPGITGVKSSFTSPKSPSPLPTVSEPKKSRLLGGASARGGSMTPPALSGGSRGTSPAPILKGSKLPAAGGGSNLLSLWTSKNSSTAASRHSEFAGRKTYGNFAKLYVSLDEDKTLVKEEENVHVKSLKTEPR